MWYENLPENEKKLLVNSVTDMHDRILTGEFDLRIALYAMLNYGFKLGKNFKDEKENSIPNDLLEGIDFSGL